MHLEDRVEALLVRYVERRLTGRDPPDVAELCADCPEVLAPLRAAVARYEDVARQLSDAGADSALLAAARHLRPEPVTSASGTGTRRFAPGDVLAGRFRIRCLAGRGGMGEVYRAEDTRLGREVAVKVLPRAFTSDAERLARFQREARLVASLSHPFICALYDVGTADDIHFLVMELVDGEPLDRLLARGVAPDEAIRIAHQMAEALEAAHARGVLHRDLKPANVMLTTGGVVKVLDFGLAKAWVRPDGASPAPSRSATPTAGITLPGAVLGTAGYMSPEQARGEEADPRSDIWAWGVVVYEMLAGIRLFSRPTVADTVAAVLGADVDWRALPDATPWQVRTVLRRALVRDPKRRLHAIADARIELEEALEGVVDGGGPEQAVAVRGPRALTWMLVATTLVLALVAALLANRHSAPAERQVVQAAIPAPPGTVFNLDPVSPGPPVVSPDGRRLAFSARTSDTGEVLLWVRNLADPEARPVPGTEEAAYPFWSPDSQFIAFFASGTLNKVDADGGPPELLAWAPYGKGGTWNDDGVIVFAPTHASPLHRVSAGGGDSTPVTSLDVEGGETSHLHPRFLPGGKHFLYIARMVGTGPKAPGNAIMVGNLDGSPGVELMRGFTNADYASGHLLFVRRGTLMAQPFDPVHRELTGEPLPIAEDVHEVSGAALGVFSASLTGVLAFQSDAQPRNSVLRWRGRHGEELGTVGELPGTFSEVRLDPTNTRALVAFHDQEAPDRLNRDIWILDLRQGVRTRFTFSPAIDGLGAWSPDGSRIAFSSNRNGQFSLYVKPVEGHGEAELLYADRRPSYAWSWSPDASFLLFHTIDQGLHDLWALPLGGGDDAPLPLQASDNSEMMGTVSPDSRWLAYACDESGRFEVYVTDFPEGGRKWQVSSRGGAYPVWNAAGTEIFYAELPGSYVAAAVDGSGPTFRVGDLTELFRSEERGIMTPSQYDATFDGQRFLTVTALPPDNPPPMTLVLDWTQLLKRNR